MSVLSQLLTFKKHWNKLLDKNWLFPLLILIWGLISIFFGEKLPANDGLGWDGFKYAQMVRELLNSPIIDNYYVLRIFPPFLVHTFLSVLGLEFSNVNIIRAFEYLNLSSLVVATYVLKLIMNELKINYSGQMLAFTMFLLSHPVSKYVFYYPVLTDAPAICSGALILYFYLKDQPLNLALSIVIATFTLPLLLYLGVLLLAFPRQITVPQPLPTFLTMTVMGASMAFITALVIYWYFILKVSYDFPYTLQVDPDLVYISFLFVLLPFAYFPKLIGNRQYLTWTFWLQTARPLRWLIALLLFLALQSLANYLNYEGKLSGYLTARHTFSSMALSGLTRPGMTLAGAFSYYGMLTVLLLLFWRKFSSKILEFGVGPGLALFMTFMLLGSTSQARVFNAVFVWLVVFLVYALNEYKFNKWFYLTTALISFLACRAWLPVRYGESPLNADGTVGFPNQKFLMNLGPWVSEYVWFLQFSALLITLSIYSFILYDIKIGRSGVVLTKKYL